MNTTGNADYKSQTIGELKYRRAYTPLSEDATPAEIIQCLAQKCFDADYEERERSEDETTTIVKEDNFALDDSGFA